MSCVAIALFFFGMVYGQEAYTATGFIADNYCIQSVIAADGANMVLGPDMHSAKCALMPPCVASGYALLTNYPNATNTNNYKVLLTLDPMSNAKAVQYFQANMNRNNLLVTLEGTYNANKTVSVRDMVDIGGMSVTAPAMGSTMVTLEGILSDNLCIHNRVDAVGNNMTTNAHNHTVMCALMVPCIASGYGMMKRLSDGTYVPMAIIDDSSKDMVLAFLRGLSGQRQNLTVRVQGTLNSMGKVVLQSMGGLVDLVPSGMMTSMSPTTGPMMTMSPMMGAGTSLYSVGMLWLWLCSVVLVMLF